MTLYDVQTIRRNVAHILGIVASDRTHWPRNCIYQSTRGDDLSSVQMCKSDDSKWEHVNVSHPQRVTRACAEDDVHFLPSIYLCDWNRIGSACGRFWHVVSLLGWVTHWPGPRILNPFAEPTSQVHFLQSFDFVCFLYLTVAVHGCLMLFDL